MRSLNNHSSTRRPRSAPTSLRADGFTIVELMIATLVFSVILLVITVGVIHFTAAYYKGINSSTTQTLARSISDEVSQAIQFSGAQPIVATTGFPANTGVICVGNQEFYYNLGQEITSSTSTALHVWNVAYGECYNSPASGANYYKSAASGYSTGKELLQNRMRLTQFDVSDIDGGATDTFAVNVGIAYGDDDLLCAPESVSNSCRSDAANITDFTVPDLNCKPDTGSQFCAVINLTTNAQSRLNFGG